MDKQLALLETTVKTNEEKAAVVEVRLASNKRKVEIIESENSKMLTNMEKQLELMVAMQASIANNRSPSSAITVRERPRTVMVYERNDRRSRRRRTPNGVKDDSATDAPTNPRNSRQLNTPVNLQYEDNLDQA